MATGFLAAGAVIGGIGAYKGYKAGKAAAKEAKALGFANAEAQKAETEEAIERTEDANRLTEANIETNIGASGFSVGGSLDKYLDSVKTTHESDVDWMRTSGASRDAIMARENSARASMMKSQAKSSFYQGIGSSLGSAGGAASSYKKSGWGF